MGAARSGQAGESGRFAAAGQRLIARWICEACRSSDTYGSWEKRSTEPRRAALTPPVQPRWMCMTSRCRRFSILSYRALQGRFELAGVESLPPKPASSVGALVSESSGQTCLRGVVEAPRLKERLRCLAYDWTWRSATVRLRAEGCSAAAGPGGGPCDGCFSPLAAAAHRRFSEPSPLARNRISSPGHSSAA